MGERTMQYIGAIEAGGTKFNCAVGTTDGKIIERVRVPTTSPQETLTSCLAFFRTHSERYPLSALGIAAFGPLDLHANSATYGYITTTPKPGWGHTDLLSYFKRSLQIPATIDTDVNGAALAESLWGAAAGLKNVIYLTIGTGIGGGALVDGSLVHGLVHPEMGHIRLSPAPGDNFKGVCPYHGNCFEGLASGPALEARWGTAAYNLPPDHESWNFEVDYIGQALSSYICILSPERIVLGGGVMQQQFLLPRIRRRVLELINGYIASPSLQAGAESYIVAPGLEDCSGLYGALALGSRCVGNSVGRN